VLAGTGDGQAVDDGPAGGRLGDLLGGRVAGRTVGDALVQDAVRAAAWTTDAHGGPVLLRMTTIPAKDGIRAGDLLDRRSTVPAPNKVWVTDFTCVRPWGGRVHVAFVVDTFTQKIVSRHAATSKPTELVMVPLRMASWQRDREGHPAVPGGLAHHSDTGSRRPSAHLTEHVALERVRPSIGTVGDAYDNCLTKAVNRLHAAERVRPLVSAGPDKTIPDMKQATAGRVKRYNNPGPHRTGTAHQNPSHHRSPRDQRDSMLSSRPLGPASRRFLTRIGA
jgi:transposase InsO family protein